MDGTGFRASELSSWYPGTGEGRVVTIRGGFFVLTLMICVVKKGVALPNKVGVSSRIQEVVLRSGALMLARRAISIN